MNQTAIETRQINGQQLFDKHRMAEKLIWCRKLAEIDYMLFLISKAEIFRQMEIYQEENTSALKEKLSKRLLQFAEAETYRDYSFQSRATGKIYRVDS